MRQLIGNDLSKCVGCNRCIRTCPVDEANVAYVENGVTKVRIDHDKCISCGACLPACPHDSRYYMDDTERFFDDLRKGMPISIFCAPAARANLEGWDQILALLRQMGANTIYDVSLGADICTWAHIRYIQKHAPESVITQPCPVIVDYILMHRTELVPYLSPVHSPMLCTAIYMRKYEGITDKIAAISPCIAKANEFDQTGDLVHYNITFVKLEEYIKKHNLKLPSQGSGYDHPDSSLGSIYSMPGGLKENVEFMLGNELRIDKGEGQGVVYRMLDTFAKEDKANLPAIFDVLNCAEGCNLGTGCHHDRTFFEVNSAMDQARQAVIGRDYDYFVKLYETYDQSLRLEDFIRRYQPRPARRIPYGQKELETAFSDLNKHDQVSRNFNCGACGSDTCTEMAVKIAKGINTADCCIQKVYENMHQEHTEVVNWQTTNASAIQSIEEDIAHIQQLSDDIVGNVENVGSVINVYESMTQEINKIAMSVHLISMNASIEAARAGEQGRSFTVVAEAIRALAGDTQASTNRIIQATSDAKSALESISGLVETIGSAIRQSHENVGDIFSSTQRLLAKDESNDATAHKEPLMIRDR
jgi:Methyl-accepting chemotaxis protein